MKRIILLFLCTGFCLLCTLSTTAQESSKKTKAPKAAAEVQNEGPIMFRFEPDFLDQNEKKKAEIARTRSIIDTLNVSERKRLKLLRDLYKNGISKRLQKALLVENTYEDIEE